MEETVHRLATDELPFVLGPLIGRTGEAAEIGSLLATARLLTITGPGGVGKTRLAGQIATASRDSFPDGVRWVDLASLDDPQLVPHLVAARCGIETRGGTAVLEALVTDLGRRRLLLVLDNCEHLLTPCARLIEALLSACPGLHVLATSRESLSVPGEVVWLLAPLGVPPEDADTAAEKLLSYDAVALFVARVAAALPGFRLAEDNAASIARICRRVDGLPLAMELAAARLRLLSPAELAERLDDTLGLLTHGSRTAPARQQTLRGALDWSYRLLSEAERVLFGRLAVFTGSFPLKAAERICAGEGVGETEVLGVLANLVEKSLVTVHERAEETRYRLLEPINQYARERLAESGGEEETRRRHRDWYAALCARAAASTGPDQRRWLDCLESEHANLRTALGWSLVHREAPAAGQMAAGIWQFWLLRGHLHEGRRWLGRILADLTEPAPLRAHLLWVAGILARPDGTLAQRYFEESLAISRTLGDGAGIARAVSSLGFLAQARDDNGRALAYLEESLPLVRVSPDRSARARVLSGLALSLLTSGDDERAMTLGLEALALCQEIGDQRGVAAATANLGLIWHARGDVERAAKLWDESLEMRRQLGDLGGIAHALLLIGDLETRQGRHARAIDLYREGLILRRKIGDEDGIPPILEGLARVAGARDDPIAAIHLAATADTLRTATGVPLPRGDRADHDRLLASLRTRVGVDSFAQTWDEGRALSLAQVLRIVEALGTPSDSPAPGDSFAGPPASPARAEGLTRREIDVLRLLTFGLTYAQMAETLSISPRTVDAHVRAIFGKLDVHSRSAATRVALQERLV